MERILQEPSCSKSLLMGSCRLLHSWEHSRWSPILTVKSRFVASRKIHLSSQTSPHLKLVQFSRIQNTIFNLQAKQLARSPNEQSQWQIIIPIHPTRPQSVLHNNLCNKMNKVWVYKECRASISRHAKLWQRLLQRIPTSSKDHRLWSRW